MLYQDIENINHENIEDTSKNSHFLIYSKKKESEFEQLANSHKTFDENFGTMKKLTINAQKTTSKKNLKNDYLYDIKFEETMNFSCYFPKNNMEEVIKLIQMNYKWSKSSSKIKKTNFNEKR